MIGDARYPSWNPSQVGVEDFAAQIEDHGMSERGEWGVSVLGPVEGLISGDISLLYIIQV